MDVQGADGAPDGWDRIPPHPIDAARPTRCPSCGACSRLLDGEVILHGNGVRWLPVVLPGGDRGRVAMMGVRRFECKACSAGCSVAPIQVVARHLYSLAAVVHAWLLAAVRPLASGTDDEAVYALQGVDRRGRRHAPGGPAGQRRWRSLRRWAASIPAWWPTRPAVGNTWRQRAAALLVGFLPGDGGRDGAVRRALSVHAAGGTAV